MIKTSTILVLRTPSHEGAGCSIKWTTPLLRAMSGIELSRVRTELRLLPHEPINQSLLVSRAGIVMQSSDFLGPLSRMHSFGLLRLTQFSIFKKSRRASPSHYF